jgi:hypothetical protein
VVVVSEKFFDGAYLVVILVPLLVAMMLFVKRQYTRAGYELAVAPDLVVRALHREERVVVPIPGLNRAVIQAINVGRSVSDDVRAVYISDDPEAAAALRTEFERQVPGVPLVVVESPYRTLVGPLLAYLDVLDSAWPPDKPAPITFVIIPEYVARSWWERILYNQSAKRLRAFLLGRPHTVVVAVPYRREDAALFESGLGADRLARTVRPDGTAPPDRHGRPPAPPASSPPAPPGPAPASDLAAEPPPSEPTPPD